MKRLMNLVSDESGIQHAEEAILLALIAIAAVGATKALASGVTGAFNKAAVCEGGTVSGVTC